MPSKFLELSHFTTFVRITAQTRSHSTISESIISTKRATRSYTIVPLKVTKHLILDMAQGAVKSKAKPALATKPKATKGAKVKKQKSTKADKLQKRYTAGLVSKTEKLLGERAGHLELIGKGKKAKKDEKHKGGSRKFG